MNNRCRVEIGAWSFVESWNVHDPAYHCVVGMGYIARQIENLGKLLALEVTTVRSKQVLCLKD
ncbi:MAG: hypothetical protein NTY19_37910 [Planctomycetota bacterium]|nr:hypothetical protein [Planctomycetota bacterium]